MTMPKAKQNAINDLLRLHVHLYSYIKANEHSDNAIGTERSNRAKYSGKYFSEYTKQIEAEEKDHRKFSGGRNGLSIEVAVKLFAIQALAECLWEYTDDFVPSMSDIFEQKLSYSYAWGVIATLDRQKLKEILNKEVYDRCKNGDWDYAKLNKR